MRLVLCRVVQASGAVTEGVEVALDPSELDFDTATMTARYVHVCVCMYVCVWGGVVICMHACVCVGKMLLFQPPSTLLSLLFPSLLSASLLSSLLSFPLFLHLIFDPPPPSLSLCRYEEQLREQQNQLQKEDLSDMVAEHAAKQKVGS